MDFFAWLRRVVFIVLLVISGAIAFVLLAPTFLRDVENETDWRRALQEPPIASLNAYLAACASCGHVVEARQLLDRVQRGSGLLARLDLPLDVGRHRREQIAAALLSGDGRHVVTSGTRAASFWDAGTGARLHDLEMRVSAPVADDADQFGTRARAMAISRDGRRVALLSDAGAIWLWDSPNGPPSGRVALGVPDGERLAFAPDGRRLLWFASEAVGLIDLEQRSAVPIAHPEAQAAGFASDGTLVTASRTAITRWQADGRTQLGSIAIETYATPLAVVAAGTLVLFASQERLEIWDASTGARRQTLGPLADDVRDACAAGTRIVIGTRDGILSVWDGAREIARQRAHPNGLERLDCDPAGERVLTLGAYKREAKLWSIERLVAAGQFQGPSRFTGDLDSVPPEGFYGRMVVAAADTGLADHIPRVSALFDLYEQELTLAAFIGFGVVLFGFVFRSWLR